MCSSEKTTHVLIFLWHPLCLAQLKGDSFSRKFCLEIGNFSLSRNSIHFFAPTSVLWNSLTSYGIQSSSLLSPNRRLLREAP